METVGWAASLPSAAYRSQSLPRLLPLQSPRPPCRLFSHSPLQFQLIVQPFPIISFICLIILNFRIILSILKFYFSFQHMVQFRKCISCIDDLRLPTVYNKTNNINHC